MTKGYVHVLAGKYLKNVLIFVILAALLTASNFALPLVLRSALNNYQELSTRLLVMYFSIFVLTFLIRRISDYTHLRFERKFLVAESKALFTKVFKMDYLKLNKFEPTYLFERIGMSVNSFYGLFASAISRIIICLSTIIITLVLMFFTNIFLFILFAALIPISFFGMKKANSILSKESANVQKVGASENKNLKSVIGSVDFIKQQGDYSGILNMMEKFSFNIQLARYRFNNLAKKVGIFLDFATSSIQSILHIYVIYMFLANRMSFADMVFVNQIFVVYFGYVNSLSNLTVDFSNIQASSDFVENELLNNSESDGEEVLDRQISDLRIEIKNALGYDENVLINQGEAYIKKGDIVGISGDSGIGKSTIAKTLNKLIPCNTVYINNKDISLVSNSFLRSKIFFMSQQVLLLPMTIKENILMGSEADDALWKKLLEKNFMKKFLDMPDKLETYVFENGTNLSGGDKQKIVLARLFISNPDIIVLDEATSSIDKQMGLELLDDITSTFTDRIIIIISHYDYVFRYCNKIISIKDKTLEIQDVDRKQT